MKKTLLTVIALVAVLGVAQAAPFQTTGMLQEHRCLCFTK